MQRVLFYDCDSVRSVMMQRYLGWLGFSVDLLNDRESLMEGLGAKGYALLIFDLISRDHADLEIFKKIRLGDTPYRDIGIIVACSEAGSLKDFLDYRKLNIYFINSYAGISEWESKIHAVLNNQRGQDDEKK